MRDKKVVIIGGSGFLGQALMIPLLSQGIEVYYGDLNPIVGMEKYFIPLNFSTTVDIPIASTKSPFLAIPMLADVCESVFLKIVSLITL